MSKFDKRLKRKNKTKQLKCSECGSIVEFEYHQCEGILIMYDVFKCRKCGKRIKLNFEKPKEEKIISFYDIKNKKGNFINKRRII